MAVKKIYFLSISLIMAMCTFAQNSNEAKGDFALKNHDFVKALSIYKKAFAADTLNISLKEKLAGVYFATGDYQNAEILYAQLVANPKSGKMNEFYYAQTLCANDKYELAEKAYSRYTKNTPGDVHAEEFKNFAKTLRSLADKGVYEVTDVPENSDLSDMGPTFCVYGLCFSSHADGGTIKHHDVLSGKAFYNLFILPGISPLEAKTLEKKRNAVKNIKSDEGPATFSHDGSEIIFTKSNKTKAPDGTVKLGLYEARFDSVHGKWVDVRPINITNNTYNMAHPALSKDGKQLFFVSDMPGGFGGTDIYVSNKTGNQWGEPVNLGNKVNTAGRELFPFIGDNGTLFFSSDSHIGLGGFDIYSASYENGIWGNVQNLGAPFNSRYDDFGFICNGNKTNGYFVSTRPGGKGNSDIYKFAIKK